MSNKVENNENIQNSVEFTECQIFEKIKEDLSPIQENLAEKKITVDEAKSELKKINDWLQWVNIEQQDKKEIWKAFEKLTKLERNIDEKTLKEEVNEIIKILETLTKKDLANLKQNVQKTKNISTHERPIEVQQWIQKSSNNLDITIDKASEDKNPFARLIGKIMKWLNS